MEVKEVKGKGGQGMKIDAIDAIDAEHAEHAELVKMLKYTHLPGLLSNWERYLEVAQKEDFSHVRFLKYIVEEEYKVKRENSRKMRLHRAKIGEKLVIETFPFDKQPNLDKKRVLDLYDSIEYMPRNQNIIWIGPTGTGKTGLATAFLIHAICHRLWL